MIHYGLKGVTAAETRISFIDGAEGKLIYRGYDISEVSQRTFEEAAYLLWYGEWPDMDQLLILKGKLQRCRELPGHVTSLLRSLPREMDLMSVLRTAVSALGAAPPSIEEAIRLTAVVPVMIACRKAWMDNRVLPDPVNHLDHAEHFLYMLFGSMPTETQRRALETYMILTMEHGMNASAFSARVTASTLSDIHSAVTSAIGTMKGPLHGGAPSEVLSFLAEAAESSDIEELIRQKVYRGERLMGFGHRVYKTRDPRAEALKAVLLSEPGDDEWLNLSLKVEEASINILSELKPGRALYTNVEFYAAAIMKSMNMKADLFTPVFTAARMTGWTAHILEQTDNNTLFRPDAKYVGPWRVPNGHSSPEIKS